MKISSSSACSKIKINKISFLVWNFSLRKVKQIVFQDFKDWFEMAKVWIFVRNCNPIIYVLCTGPRCAHTMPLTMSDCVCSFYLTHSVLLSLSPHLFLFAWQLCKPAPLRLRTDRAIFSRHLISASRTVCTSAPRPLGLSTREMASFYGSSSDACSSLSFGCWRPSRPICYCHLLLVSLLVIVMAFLNVIFHLAHTCV